MKNHDILTFYVIRTLFVSQIQNLLLDVAISVVLHQNERQHHPNELPLVH